MAFSISSIYTAIVRMISFRLPCAIDPTFRVLSTFTNLHSIFPDSQILYYRKCLAIHLQTDGSVLQTKVCEQDGILDKVCFMALGLKLSNRIIFFRELIAHSFKFVH
jgi:hypothetical protein